MSKMARYCLALILVVFTATASENTYDIVRHIVQENVEMKEKLNRLEDVVKNLQEEIKSIRHSSTKETRPPTSHVLEGTETTGILTLANSTGNAVGFYAEGPNQERNYTYLQKIEFPNVRFNAGGHYMVDYHEFACPVTGLYFFTSSQLAAANSAHCYTIVVAGEPYAKAFVTDDIGFVQISNSVVAVCQQDRVVYIRQCMPDTYSTLFAGSYNTFSGFLIDIFE